MSRHTRVYESNLVFPAPVPREKWRFWKKAPFVTASDHPGTTTKHATHWACPSMSPCPRLNVSHFLFVCFALFIDLLTDKVTPLSRHQSHQSGATFCHCQFGRPVHLGQATGRARKPPLRRWSWWAVGRFTGRCEST